MKQKKVIKICILFIIGIILCNCCLAYNQEDDSHVLNILGNQNTQKNTITFPYIGMTLKVNNDFYDIIQGLEEGDERVEKFKQSKAFFAQAGIIYNAVDSLEENSTKEIIILVTQNQSSQQIENLTNLTGDELNKASENFFEKLKQDTQGVEFEETILTQTQNGNKYMMAVSKQNIEEGIIKANTYYTIISKNLIGITFKYINREIDKEEITQTIESIEFDTNQIKQIEQLEIIKVISIYAIIVLAIIIFAIIERKTYKTKILQITEKQKKEYQHMGGLLAVFFVTVLIMLLNAIISITKISQIEELGIKIIFYIQNILIIFVIGYILFLFIKKRESKTPKKIQNTIIIIGIINSLASIIKIGILFGNVGLNNTINYYLQESLSLVTTISYMVIWNTYFVVSKRINIYYQIELKK